MANAQKNFIKFLTSPLLVAVLTLRELIQLVKELAEFSINSTKDLEIPQTLSEPMEIQIDYFDFVLKLLIGTLLMYMFRLFFKIKDEMFIWNVVQQERALTIYKDAGGVPVAKKFVEDEKDRVR